MKMTKKILSLAMILATIVSTMIIVPLTANAEATLADLGAGTEASPYVIDSADDLMLLSNAVIGVDGQTTYFELGANIDMTGKEYKGPKAVKDLTAPIHFDGKDYTISNLTTSAGFEGGSWTGGLFGMLRGNDVVKNVTLDNVTVNGTQAYAGGLIGVAKAPLTVENVTVNGTVTGNETTTEIGGFVGGLERAEYDVIFTNCVNNATVTAGAATKSIGGFIGNFHDATKLTMTGCVNNGAVTDGAVTSECAGFVARFNVATNVTMTNCINNGTITADTAILAAGMFSNYSLSTATSIANTWTFTNCINNANVTSNGEGATAGGLIAEVWNTPVSGTFTHCFNTANITAIGTVGGLFGYYEPMNAKTDLVLANCGNTGEITGGNRLGGLAGKVSAKGSGESTASFTNCYNTVNLFMIKELATKTDQYAAGGVTFTNCASLRGLVYSNAPDVVADFTTVNVEADEATLQSVIEAAHSAAHNHMYAAACSAKCLICGEARTDAPGTHKYDNGCDATCNACGEERTGAGHVYDNECDATCNNECGYTREDIHVYTNACDDECNLCQTKRTAPHEFAEACSETCSACGAANASAVAHTYTNDCDKTCNVCYHERTVGDHAYDSDSDQFCNNCGEKRAPASKTKDTTTKAPAKNNTTTTVAPQEEKKGCGSALNSTYAVIALVSVLGLAFVAKKREEN